jgi:hypothetical protein
MPQSNIPHIPLYVIKNISVEATKMRKMNRIAGLLLAMFLLCLAGCGETSPDRGGSSGPPNGGSDPKPKIPLTAPQQIEVFGFDGALQINFTAVSQAQNITPRYDLWYGTNPNRTGSGNINLGKDVLTRTFLDDGTPRGPVSGMITGLTNGVEYNIWINADFGTLGASAYTMTTGVPMPVPSTPTDVTATAGERSIDVKWSAIDHVSSYTVAYHTTNNIFDATIVPNITTPGYMITGLENGTRYYIWVSARNYNGSSPYSERISATPAVATEPPANPGSLTVRHGAQRITATWDAVPGAAYYELYWSVGNDSSSITEPPIRVEIAGGTVSASITNLVNGTEYSVWVKAVNSAGGSNFSPAARSVPRVRTPPVNFSNPDFVLGIPTGEFIFGEDMPPLSPLSRTGPNDYQDNLHRSKETPIGNLFTDGALWYLNVFRTSGENVDFVFLNSGYIDSTIRPQDPAVTVRDLLRVVGNNSDRIVILSMRGSDIKDLFEHAASHAPRMGFRGNHSDGPGGQLFRSSGNWPIVSGEVNYTIRYPFVTREFMENNPPKIGSALASLFFFGNIEPGTLKLNGADFEDNRIYRVATTDFVVDEIYMEIMLRATARENTNILYWHAVAEYIYDAEYITPAIDGRIRIKGGVPGGPFGVAEGFNQHCPADAAYSEIYGCVFN